MISILRRIGGVLGMLALVAGVTGGQVAAQAAYSDAKLDAFVTAALAVDDLVKTWAPRIDNADSQEKADQLRTQANTELIDAVESTDGISLDEYRQIVRDAGQDADLSARIQKIVEEKAAD